jgi:hypothetical protein
VSAVVFVFAFTPLFALATLFAFTTLCEFTADFVVPDLPEACAELPNPKLTVAASTPAKPARRQRSQRVRAGIAARSFWIAGIFPLPPEKRPAGKIARRGSLFRRPGSLRESRGFASLSRERFAFSFGVR